MTNQPKWELVANLGDVNFADYGGMLVYRDTTGVYQPEAEVYEPNEAEETGGTVYRFILEPARFKTNGSYDEATRQYNMVWHNEWFVKDIASVASSAGTTACQLLRGLLSNNPLKLASAYVDIVGHFGCFEFDQDPLQLTETEIQTRYAKI